MHSHEDNRAYTRRYIWDRFRYSWLTLSGLLLPSLSSIAMMAAEWPVALQSLNVVALLGMVGVSYWWHWFYDVEALARKGADEYLRLRNDERRRQLMARYAASDFGRFPKYLAMQEELQERYDAFREALDKQQIIAPAMRKMFEQKAQQAFESGVGLLAEISDILTVQSAVEIEEIRREMQENAKGASEQLEQIAAAYRENDENLSHLTRTLQNVIHSFVLALSHLAAVTSKNHNKESELEVSELQSAIDSAKATQQKLHQLSLGRDDDLQSIYEKYTNKE